jgi:Flp pilus assembly protein TadG
MPRSRLDRAMRTWRGLRRCARGAVAIEFVMIAPVVILTLIGFVDLGMLTFYKMEVSFAAQAGARYALEYGWDSVGANIQSVVQDATGLGSQISIVSPTAATVLTCGCPGANGAITLSAASCTGGPNNGPVTCPNETDTPPAGEYLTIAASVSYHYIVQWPILTNPLTMTASQTVRIN